MALDRVAEAGQGIDLGALKKKLGRFIATEKVEGRGTQYRVNLEGS